MYRPVVLYSVFSKPGNGADSFDLPLGYGNNNLLVKAISCVDNQSSLTRLDVGIAIDERKHYLQSFTTPAAATVQVTVAEFFIFGDAHLLVNAVGGSAGDVIEVTVWAGIEEREALIEL
jgi:hypothetical protein